MHNIQLISAKEFGKTAKANEINAPSLDVKFLKWLATMASEKKIDNFVQWWEGWYEALNKSLSRQSGKIINNWSRSSR